MKFEIYQEAKQGLLANALTPPQWRWRFLASNGKIIADSGEGYFNREDCVHGIELVMRTNQATPVVEVGFPLNALSGILGGYTTAMPHEGGMLSAASLGINQQSQLVPSNKLASVASLGIYPKKR
jgi:uncharacterized protein YegP (UPF0339 family)